MSMVMDTAELEPDNAAGVEGQQDDAPETGFDPAAEAEAEGTTDPAIDLDGFDDDALSAHPRVAQLLKDREARAAESSRQKSEVETSRRLAKQAREFVERGGVARETEKALQKALESGNVRDALDEIQKISNAVYVANTNQNLEMFDAALMELMPEKASVPVKRAEEIERIKDGVGMGRKSADDLIRARVELLRDMAIEAKLPELRKQWQAEMKKQQTAAAKTDAERDADSQRAGQAQPTGVAGKGNGALTAKALESMTQQQVADLYGTEEGRKKIELALATG